MKLQLSIRRCTGTKVREDKSFVYPCGTVSTHSERTTGKDTARFKPAARGHLLSGCKDVLVDTLAAEKQVRLQSLADRSATVHTASWVRALRIILKRQRRGLIGLPMISDTLGSSLSPHACSLTLSDCGGECTQGLLPCTGQKLCSRMDQLHDTRPKDRRSSCCVGAS